MRKILKESYFLLIDSGVSKKEILVILISSVVTVFFEILGIGIFIPIIDVIINDHKKIDFIGLTIDLENINQSTLYFSLSFFVIVVIGIKSIIWVFYSYLIQLH